MKKYFVKTAGKFLTISNAPVHKTFLPSAQALSIYRKIMTENFKYKNNITKKNLFYEKVSKKYTHIDFPLTKEESNIFEKSLLNWKKIKTHRFLPMITFNITFKKYPNNGKKNIKRRKISLVSHYDAGVYFFLSKNLNKKYNDFSYDQNISDVAVAYRSDLKNNTKISNITVAKEVFDFIDKQNGTWIMKGDFKNFFDRLNHCYLEKNMLKVLNLEDKSLEYESWIKVLDKLTNYKYIEKNKIENYITNPEKKVYKKNPKKFRKAYFESREEFGIFIKNHLELIKQNKKKGIPQGTSISAILANVYMIEFDKFVKQMVTSKGGIYRRYSDDFIIVIPKEKNNINDFKKLYNEIIMNSKKIVDLEISDKKTKQISESKGFFTDVSTEKTCGLDYLGFLYQDNTVSIRGKSIYKFYYRGRRSIHSTYFNSLIYNVVKDEYSNKNFEINDDNAYKILITNNFINKNTNKFKVKLYLKRTERIMYKVRENVALPDIKKTHTRYLMHIEKSSPKHSFLSYAKNCEKVFSKNNPSYKISFLKQANKSRNRLIKLKNDLNAQNK
ncbi:reverse transcriptase domain-containing protein [Companilactobacillus metriopterae]|uniref:reverse transcriptase domain-containing protein n=1 Tax=Companilactobacillus metriopterae TaxID=1909267 RepID=UPI0013E93A1D|nr:reverse transcriptase domain-containing protein [Companilactobacillus metriopterae]